MKHIILVAVNTTKAFKRGGKFQSAIIPGISWVNGK